MSIPDAVSSAQWIAAGVGHLALWCWIFNRTHATSFPRFWRKLIEKLIILVVVALPAFALWMILRRGTVLWELHWQQAAIGMTYWLVCAVASVYFTAMWLWRRLSYRVPPQVVRMPPQWYDVSREVAGPLNHGWFARLLRWVPGNQSNQVSLEEARLHILPEGSPLVGLRICHLSDFHLTGALDRSYFKFVVDRVNRWAPDLIVLTGDFVDEPRCLDWIDPVFEPLRAGSGKFYVLGNHDRRIANESELRTRLMRAGLSMAAGRWQEVPVRGGRIGIAGNELPWYSPATPIEFVSREVDLTIALAHSPDQVAWMEGLSADLAFAGHLHGGQICLPLVGAIIAPSRYGVRYVPEFHATRSGLMIVSRGLSGDEPIRIRCRPHVGCYILAPLPVVSSVSQA